MKCFSCPYGKNLIREFGFQVLQDLAHPIFPATSSAHSYMHTDTSCSPSYLKSGKCTTFSQASMSLQTQSLVHMPSAHIRTNSKNCIVIYWLFSLNFEYYTQYVLYKRSAKMSKETICNFKKVSLTQRSDNSERSHHKTWGIGCGNNWADRAKLMGQWNQRPRTKSGRNTLP